MRRLRAALAGAALLGALAACGSDQDPGVPQGTGPTVTSHLLDPCPEGGPDASTPPAGCLGPDGTVLYP